MLAIANQQFQELALLAGAVGAGVVVLAFVVLIVYPAWNSYGRMWERFSALFLTLYVLVAMLGVGALIGLGVFAVLGNQI